MNITDKQVETLRADAGERGDLNKVATCDDALDGDPAALAALATSIAYQRYVVSNSAGGTELRTHDRERAIHRLLTLQFPGAVTDTHTGAELDVSGYELDETGRCIVALTDD